MSSRPAWSTKQVPGQPDGPAEKPYLEKQTNKQTKKKERKEKVWVKLGQQDGLAVKAAPAR